MTKFIFYILAFSVLVACNSNTILKKPDNLLPKEKMVNILVESFIAKNAKSVRNINNKRNVNYLSLIYKEQGTDSVTFNTSLRYYTSDISANEEILKRVKESIDKKLEVLKTERDNIFNGRVDSLKNVREIVLNENIISLKNNQEKKLTEKIDSVNKTKEDVFSKQISKLKIGFKDTLKLTSILSIKKLKDSVHQQIAEIQKTKTDSINKGIENIKKLHQEIVDKKIEVLEKEDEDYIKKKTNEFNRDKYR